MGSIWGLLSAFHCVSQKDPLWPRPTEYQRSVRSSIVDMNRHDERAGTEQGSPGFASFRSGSTVSPESHLCNSMSQETLF